MRRGTQGRMIVRPHPGPLPRERETLGMFVHDGFEKFSGWLVEGQGEGVGG
jgi:hypothetical protein